MPDNIKDIYSIISKSNLFVDENDFRNQVNSNPKEVFEFISKDKNTQGLFVDFNDFQDNLKKKVGGEVSSPTKSQLVLPDFEKGKAFAEKGFLMKPEGTKEEIIETPDSSQQGLLLNLVSSLDKGFAKNFISSPIKGLGTVLQGTTKKVLGGTGEGYISDKLIKLGDYLNNAIDEVTPQDEEFKNTLWDQAGQAVGQIGSLVLTGGLTGAAGKGAALVSQAPKGAAITAVKTLGSQLSSPTAISAGLSMGQAEFDRAIQAGATDDQAFEAFYKNAVTGSVLETVPVMQFFKRFNKSTAGSVANYIKTKGVAGLTGGIEEMTTEVMQQIYANKTAKDIYNINQDILDGVGSSGGIGFGIGFLLNAMGANAKILRKQGKVQEADVLENQVKQYEDNLENPKVTSGNKVSAKDIVTQGPEIGTQKAVQNLDRDLANNVITPEQYQQGVVFAEKAAQVADKIPETVIGESRVKSVELLVERNDIKQANEILIQQKQTTDEAYHAGIDEEIKANEERIKKIDTEVYNIAKKPSKDFGDKKYIVDGEEVSQEAYEALKGKPLGTKTIVKTEVKPVEQEKEFIEQTDVEKRNEGYPSPVLLVKKYVADGLNELLEGEDADFQNNSIERTIAGGIKKGLDKETIIKIIYSNGNVFSFGGDTKTLENYIQNRIDGKDVRPFSEFKKNTRQIAEKVKPTENITSKEKNKKFDTPTLKSPASNYEKLYVPRNVVEEAYKNDKDNNPVFGNGNQPLNRIIERGGYSIEELDNLLPNWKEIASAQEVKPTEEKTKAFSLPSPLQDIEGLKGYQPNIRTEATRKIVNAVRYLEGLEPYTGPLDKLTNVLTDTDEYHSFTIGSKLNNLEKAVEAVKNLPSYKGFMSEQAKAAESKPIAVKEEVKPTEVNLTTAEKMNASQNRYGILKDGAEAGFIVATNPENNVVKIKGVTVNEELRGKNIAGDAYVKLGESLAKEGVSLESDSFDKMEPSATRVWEKLADKGLAVKGENSYQFKPTEVKEAPKKTYQEAIKEKQAAEKKQTRQTAGEKAAATRKTIEESNKIEASDARSAALKYLTGGKLSWDAINEVAGRVKRATLNTGAREFKSEEARSRDYVAKKGEGQSLDEAADSIWNDLSQEIQDKMDTQDVKNALMMAVSEYNSKAEMAQALIDGYKEESIEELENKYYERFGDNAEIEIDKELNQVPKNQLDIEQELINANYESEQQFQDDYWNTKEATNDFTEKAPSTKAQKAETAKGLAEAYKDLTINQKRQIINSKFDELLKELKIEKICPT